jgi:hypothetical protein
MPSCSCLNVTSASYITYTENTECSWVLENLKFGPSYTTGSIEYTSSCNGGVVFNWTTNSFSGSYRINGVVNGAWPSGQSGSFSFNLNAGDVLTIVISIPTPNLSAFFDADLTFTTATATPLPTDPTFTPTVTPSPTPSSTPINCLAVNLSNLMSYNYPYANYITFENNVYAFGGSSPYIDINFGCKGNVTIRLFPTALSNQRFVSKYSYRYFYRH